MGRKPKDALRTALRVSIHSFTALVDGKPEAMLGVSSGSLLSGKGVPWMVGTDEVYRHGRAMLEIGPAVLELFLQTFARLENVVSVQNDRAIRMLTRWGFVVGGEVETHGGVDFVPFRMERSIAATISCPAPASQASQSGAPPQAAELPAKPASTAAQSPEIPL